MAAQVSDRETKDLGLAAGATEKFSPELVEHHEEEAPTVSHALAHESLDAETGHRGACQVDHDDIEVKNLGWNDKAQRVPQPVVGGLRNEELWTLVRRFDKQIFQVKSVDQPPLANLDMNTSDDEDFTPEKMRAHLERLYVSVVISLFSFWKHIVRLRSWREYRRTSAFVAVYFFAWLLDVLLPTIVGFLLVLIVYRPSRDVCFPPAPPALIDTKTGGVQKPAAGVLASGDTITGAPENHEGEAAEQEANSFVNSIATVCSGLVVSTSAGKHPTGDPHDDNIAPDPTQMTEEVTDARAKTSGNDPNVVHDKTKRPVSKAVWDNTKPLMHLISDFVDTWERFGNALSPTPPFPSRRPRLTLVACLWPLLLGSYFTTSYIMLKGLGFVVGFVFFGDPVLTPLTALVNNNYPKWRRYVELRSSILREVPTNAQLTITLLRIGEKNKAPVPPPPRSNMPPATEPDTKAIKDLDHLGATDEEIQEAAEPESEPESGEDAKKQPKKSRRIFNLLKSTAKGGIHTALTADKAKAAAGARHAKNRRGVVKNPEQNTVAGPVRFPARYRGKKGYAYVTATATSPAVSWTSNIDDVHPVWTVSISDIDQLKKVGGLGWKSKIVVGWALEKEIVDGLVVRTKQGEEYHLTAVITRDELFNRLIAIGSQMWEAW